jgi:hypothetical protein
MSNLLDMNVSRNLSLMGTVSLILDNSFKKVAVKTLALLHDIHVSLMGLHTTQFWLCTNASDSGVVILLVSKIHLRTKGDA